MTASSALAQVVEAIDREGDTDSATAVEIEHFLSGETDGGALFEALYGAALDEPIPPQMLALVRRGCGKP